MPNLKFTDLLPLKCIILGDTANSIPTKNVGQKMPSINRQGCNLSTSFAFPLVRRKRVNAMMAEFILDAYTPNISNVNCRY